MKQSSKEYLPRVFVMMATYNGERFLGEQIDSILAQQGVSVTLRICDDLSTDDTFQIASEYQKRNNNIFATQNDENLGVAKNFMQMLFEVNSDDYEYFAFSDQDDVWMPEKLEIAIKKIKQTELCEHTRKIENLGIPVLYTSDLINVDENLKNPRRELSPLKPDETLRATMLINNWHSGCTFVFNRPMLQLYKKTDFLDATRNHDGWCYFVAYYCGTAIVDMQNSLIMRRISDSNASGEVTANSDVKKANLFNVLRPSKHNATKFAKLIYDTYKEYMTDADSKMIESFINYRKSLAGRFKWAFSGEYSSLSPVSNLMHRVKFILGRY